MDLWGALSDLLLGLRCLSCGSGGSWWCRNCVEAAWQPQHTIGPSRTPLVSAAPYEGAVREALVAHKDHGQLALVRPLGWLLANAVTELDRSGPWVLSPCPSTPTATRRRGHNHMLRVASAAGRELRRRGGQARVVTTLAASAVMVDQVGLTASGRRVNVGGAFAATPVARASSGVDQSLIIVDDITTTGATLAEAQRALITAGWSVRGSAVVAQTVARMGVAGRPRKG